MAFDKKKFISRFAQEAHKHLSQIREGILELEKQPNQKEVVNTIFRSAHTIKGSASMLSFESISEFAHAIEQVLSNVRDEKLQFNKSIADTLLQAADHLEVMVMCAQEEKAIEAPSEDLLKALKGESSPPETKQESKHVISGLRSSFAIPEKKLDALMKMISELSVLTLDSEKQLSDIKHLTHDVQMLKDQQVQPQQIQVLSQKCETLEHSMRSSEYEMKRISSELQNNLIELRMVPISLITEELPRFVRDTASALGKKAQLVIKGADTELDRTVLDTVEQALMHIIRNALDHGIESLEKRRELHKEETGTITIEAGYANGLCRLTISDDGCGIPTQALIEKAKKLNLISDQKFAEYGRNLSPQQLVDLLTLPGLSSAPIISETSGRGVGMDVVRHCIVNDLSGELHIESKSGKGTCITLLLPLNQAVMDVFSFRLGNCRLAIATSSVKRILQASEHSFIEVAKRAAMRLDEQILPVLSVHELFGQDVEKTQDFLLVVQSSAGQVVLLVDEIFGQQTALIQSLPSFLQNNQYISGCVITSSDQVMNVLNPQSLSNLSYKKSETQNKETKAKSFSILVVDDSVSTRDIEKSILESYGYRVELASDGREAFETALENQFDVVITDIEMPNMDGMQLTEKLRSEKAYRHTPIILITSRDKAEDRKKGIEAGADAYIVKSSFDQENLIQTIRTLTGELHAQY